MPGYEPVGREFESPRARQAKQTPQRGVCFVIVNERFELPAAVNGATVWPQSRGLSEREREFESPRARQEKSTQQRAFFVLETFWFSPICP